MRPTTRRERLVWFRQRMQNRKRRCYHAMPGLGLGPVNPGVLRRCRQWQVDQRLPAEHTYTLVIQQNHGPVMTVFPFFPNWTVTDAEHAIPPIVRVNPAMKLFYHFATSHQKYPIAGYHQRRVGWMSRKQNRVRGNTGYVRAIAMAVRFFDGNGAWPLWDPLGRLPAI